MLPLVGLGGLIATTAPAAEVLLTWQDNSTNEQGFRLERSSLGQAWREIATVGVDVTSVVDVDPVPDATHEYRVRAYNSGGYSAFSNVVSVYGPRPAPANTAPSIDPVASIEILAGAPTEALALRIADDETAPAALTVTARSSNPALLPDASLVLSGAGATRYLVVSPPPTSIGTTTITVSVSDGALTTRATFQLTMRVADVPPVITLLPQDVTASAGAALTLRSAAIGTGPVTLQWFHDGEAIPGATAADLVIPSAQRFHAGDYSVRVTSGGLSVLSPLVQVTVEPVATATSRLLNLSTRAWCGTGEAVLIPGFIVKGDGAADVLIRAVGPTLGSEPFNVPGVLPDPRMILKRWNGGGYDDVAENLDWGNAANVTDVRRATVAVSAFGLPELSRDAVMLTSVGSGQHTVIVDDEAQRAGVALVEIYDLGTASSGVSLSNLSNRGRVGTGDRVMILGFVVAADGPMTLLVRAVGPGLEAAGFSGGAVLRDPVLEIHGGDGAGGSRFLFANDNWGENPDQAFTASVAQQVSAFALPPGSADAALVVTLAPGSYTVIVRGPEGATDEGIALVEVYTVP